LIATHEDGRARSRWTGDLATRRLLRAAAVTDEAAGRVIDELHTGHAVVLAEVAEIAPSDARARLEDVAHAA
jgi:ubiquinone biosynthesis protein UbiJ